MLRVEAGLECRGDVGIAVARGHAAPPPGPLIAASGRWRRTTGAPSAEFAGTLLVDRWTVVPEPRLPTPAAVRGRASAELHRAFGARGPLANALVLSRTEGMDPDVRDAFARSGAAHLLSISGFHVAVVAALLVALARGVGAPGRAVEGLALGGVWGYVLLIGAPDAAVRSALLFSFVALARLTGRPLHPEGTLAAAYLALAAWDPGAPGRPGFQLSFAGALGLTRFAPAVDDGLRRLAPALPRPARSAVSAGVGATCASLPIVAWHFERVPVFGVPATMAAGPLVALAIPGVLGVLLLGPLSPVLARFAAGGADAVLAALVAVVNAFARPAWASLALPRDWVLLGGVGVAGAWLCLAAARDVGRAVRAAVVGAGAAAALALAPLARAIADRGTVGIDMIDVGQGDALLLRSPRSRWVLVDTGPRSDEHDAGVERVLPELRRLGVVRLDLVVLTHPHLDHVGGAPTVLRGVRVDRVLDPGQALGTGGYVDALEAAGARGVPWTTTARGARFTLDGMELAVLRPEGPPAGADVDPNDASVVLLLRYGVFSALFDGDAPSVSEDPAGTEAGTVTVLKVAHHGSRTSSSRSFLERVRPALALVSVGRGNSFGHPAPDVIARLQAVGARVLRTDVSGRIRVRGRPDGSWTVSVDRSDDAALGRGARAPAARPARRPD